MADFQLQLKSVDVYVSLPGEKDTFCSVLSATPQEAFAMLSMPALAGIIVKFVPNYELLEMSQE